MNAPHTAVGRFAFKELLAGFAQVNDDIDILDITLDSRQVKPGSLFLACKGINQHGLKFAEQAITQGAVAIAWEPDGSEPEGYSVPLIPVENLARNAGLIANRFFGMPSESLDVIGITGTNGKTSVASFIAQALDKPMFRCGIIGTLGCGFPGELTLGTHTTPDAVEVHRQLAFFRDQGAISVVMEVSSHALDQGRTTAVKFDTAVFTNLTRDHLDYHGDMASYSEAKRQLFLWPGLQHMVINADDSLGGELIDTLGVRIDTIAYSVNGPVAGVKNLVAKKLNAKHDGLRFSVEGSDQVLPVVSSLIGTFNVQNLLAAMGVLLVHGMSLEEAVEAITDLAPVPGRMEKFGGKPGQPLIVVDYAHTPDALKKALSSLRVHTDGKLICVFGCGGDRDWGKRPFMGEIAEHFADMHIVTNDNPRNEDPEVIVTQIRAGLKKPRRMPVILDREDAIRAALDVAESGDCVLIAGKGHEDYQIIGDERLPFSDRDTVKQLLAERGAA